MTHVRGVKPHLAALQDLGQADAPPGTPAWARHVRSELSAMIQQEQSSVYAVRNYIKSLHEHHGYTALEREDGAPFASLQEFVTTRRPFGLGFDPMLHLLIMAETTETIGIKTLAELRARQDQALAAMVEPLNDLGRPPKTATDMKSLLNKHKKGGTEKLYRLRKLKRDHPKLVERLATGELQTLREAETAAGLPKYKRLPKDPHKLIALARQEYGEAYLTALRLALDEKDERHAPTS